MIKPKRLYFDIETSFCLAWVWSTGQQYVGAENILQDSKIICIAYKWEDEDETHILSWDKKQNDKSMLKKFTKIAEKADELVGHNGRNFDQRHINARIAYHSLPRIDITFVEDTLKRSRREFRLASHKLDYLAKYFKVGKKLETGGIGLWLKVVLDNDRKVLAKMEEYCKHDVVVLEKVYQRLKPYFPVHYNLSVLNQDKTICPSCAGKLHKHGIRATSALRQVQRYRCKDCSKVFSDGVNLFKKTAHFPR